VGIFSIFGRKASTKKPSCAAVIVAAGSSQRFGGEDKLFMLLAGTPVIAHTLRVFETSPVIDSIVIVTRPEKIVLMQDVCKEFGILKAGQIVAGGGTRSESVLLGLLAAGDAEYAAIADGARPFCSPEVIERVFAAAMEFGAAAPGIPVTDTVKRVKGGVVTETLNREELVAVQTPQIFLTSLAKGALSKAKQQNKSYTDDCAAVEAIGMSVHIVEGDPKNVKITTAADILLAEAYFDEEYRL